MTAIALLVLRTGELKSAMIHSKRPLVFAPMVFLFLLCVLTKIKMPSAQKPGDCENESLHFFCCPRGLQ